MYNPFNNFVFRTPLLPVSVFFQEIEKLEKEESYWRIFLQNPLLQEAIFLASPVLYEEIGKYLSGYLTKEKDVEKMKNSVLRYYSRMCSRCTPFGLFAGFSLGRLDDETMRQFNDKMIDIESTPRLPLVTRNVSRVTLPALSHYRRYTRLDMHYLCALAQDMGKKHEIQREAKYYPNSSLYVLGDKLRYVEYFYKNSKRIHQISSVDFSEYLGEILTFAQKGAFFAELSSLVIEMLPEENLNTEDALNYIKELIENQILVSELEPEITGKDFLEQVQRVMNGILRQARNDETIPALSALLKKMDEHPPGSSINLYTEAEEIVKTTETAYEKNYLFQVDVFKPVENAVIDNKIADEILEAIGLMNQITPPYKDTTLKKFADNFYERYRCSLHSIEKL